MSKVIGIFIEDKKLETLLSRAGKKYQAYVIKYRLSGTQSYTRTYTIPLFDEAQLNIANNIIPLNEYVIKYKENEKGFSVWSEAYLVPKVVNRKEKEYKKTGKQKKHRISKNFKWKV